MRRFHHVAGLVLSLVSFGPLTFGALHHVPRSLGSHHRHHVRAGARGPPPRLSRRDTNWNMPLHMNLTDPEDPGNWARFNEIPWFKIDETMQDHARLHSYLSMASFTAVVRSKTGLVDLTLQASYGDYATLCPPTFTQGFEVLSSFNTPSGGAGFTAKVPEMEKIVIVFQGPQDVSALDWTPTSIDSLAQGCYGCSAAKGVFDIYNDIKQATNDFDVAKQAVVQTNLLFSVTGHGIGGSIAALAGLDLGGRNLTHYAHNQGMPRTFNYAAAAQFDNLYPMLAGQSLVNGNDSMVQQVPLSQDFYHLGAKVHLTGNLTQWWQPCWGNNENVTCTGWGGDAQAHSYYFTPLGSCGAADKGF